MEAVRQVVVCGGGSAGLICALTLRKKLPGLHVRLVRSKKMGVIGVGEGTVGSFNDFFFSYLPVDVGDFYRAVEPTWKLGIKFNWGRRGSFNYCFDHSCDWTWADQEYPNGFYCRDDFQNIIQVSALMDQDRVFVAKENGDPFIHNYAVYHLENEKFVNYLERQCESAGVELIDDVVVGVNHAESGGLESLRLELQGELFADLFVDASGFKSLLLGSALGVNFVSFADSLFCDRALIGRWTRTDETIRPYTTSDEMSAGWSWRIDHEDEISRGYVYSSDFLSREAAEAEFRSKNPKVTEVREVRFRPGKFENGWVKNVVAIGNASGFVEPLEATSISLICDQARTLVRSLASSHFHPTEQIRSLYNNDINRRWESIRGFLALHYQLNDRSETEFWRKCQLETRLGGHIENLIGHFEAFGPDNELMSEYLPPGDLFGVEGYLTMLVGFKKQYNHSNIRMDKLDVERMNRKRAQFANNARDNSYDSREALARIRQPDWQWH